MSIYIIAEAGVNHNGSISLAKKLVDAAFEAGADSIKFQTFRAENLVSKNASKADYQAKNTNKSESQLDMLKKLELSFDEFTMLKKYCEIKPITFLSTPFDLESIDFLQTLNLKTWKIPSGEITNLPYLIKIAQTNGDIILSTGMCNILEIKTAVDMLNENGAGKITLLHCNTEYPTPFGDVNLNAMQTMHNAFKLDVGYSDHTKGIEVALASATLGASVIEKHFTLDRSMEGPDHSISLEPGELKHMISGIRNIEKALGSCIKKPSPSEIKNMEVVRKSIVAKSAIKKGEILTKDNLAVKRPGNGISPMKWYDVVGTCAKQDFAEDELIRL